MDNTRKKSIKINAVLNVIKVCLSIIFPLITFPYATRVLHVENIGKINYGNSIVNYFSLLAALGISSYAVREGAKIRGDESRFNRFSNEIFTVNILTTAVSYVILVLTLIAIPELKEYRIVIIIQSLSIILTTLGIEWVNIIYEDYLFITVRSFIIQIVSLVLLFAFVKTPEDYLIYAGLTVVSYGIICVSNLIYCRKYLHLRLVYGFNIRKHLEPMLVFFSNSLAITVYVSADMTMIGWMIGDYYTGLYAVAVKIYQIVKKLLTAIYSVAIPRLSQYAGHEDKNEFRNLFTKICSGLLLLMVPLTAGIVAYSKDIIIILSGNEYVGASVTLKLLALALIFAVGSGVVVNCLNIPLGREKISLRATALAAVTNVVLNLFFIKLWNQDGAAVTTIIAEMIVFGYCIAKFPSVSDFVDVKKVGIQLMYGIGGVCCVAVSYMVSGWLFKGCVLHLTAGIIITGILYMLLLLVGQNNYVLEIIRKSVLINKWKQP